MLQPRLKTGGVQGVSQGGRERTLTVEISTWNAAGVYLKHDFMTVIFSIPALSTPATFGRDQHLAAVVRVRVVHVHLQLFAFIPFHDGEQIFALDEGKAGINSSKTFPRLKSLLSSVGLYLIHQSVSSYNVVCLGFQTGQGCGGIWFHFLDTEKYISSQQSLIGSSLWIGYVIHKYCQNCALNYFYFMNPCGKVSEA